MFGPPFSTRSTLAVSISAVIASAGVAGDALADHRGRSRNYACRDGGVRLHATTGYRSGFGLSINLGDAFCAPRYRSWNECRPACPPVTYCPPRVVYRPYCPPAVTYVTSPSVVYAEPQVIERPVVVQAPPTVVERPVYVDRPIVVHSSNSQQPQPQQTEAGRYQDRDLGDAYLRMADFTNAARVYNRYLTAWSGDGTVLRGLGFALIGTGNVQDGARAVTQAYKAEPTLFDRPLRQSDLGGTVGYQTILDAATRGASGDNTAEAWFTLAMLNHAAGNGDAAVISLQNARAAGLETSLLDQATLRVSPPPR